MKLSLQFPLHTTSANINMRFGNPYARAAATSRQRQDVRMFLESQLPRLRVRLPSGPNFFRVTMIRISAGLLDDGNLWGALKAVQDEVAAWIGIKDGPRDPASWKVAQQQCPPKLYAVRVEIEDDDPDGREVHKVVGPLIPRLGPVLGDCVHCGRPDPRMVEVPKARRAARKALLAEQTRLVFRRSFYALPEEQTEEDQVLHELKISGLGETPPETLIVRRRGASLRMRRRLEQHEDLGEYWLYEVPPIAAE